MEAFAFDGGRSRAARTAAVPPAASLPSPRREAAPAAAAVATAPAAAAAAATAAAPAADGASKIRQMGGNAALRICSDQVVVDLRSALKELVENALDAGATKLEVRLKEHGAEMLEVTDNGRGISRENLDGVARRHHTSKLREFDDLGRLRSFGFRGEALSSLAALSSLSVATRTEDDAVGTSLSFGRDGEISARSKVARDVGTTVCVARLFEPFAVRRREASGYLPRAQRDLHARTRTRRRAQTTTYSPLPTPHTRLVGRLLVHTPPVLHSQLVRTAQLEMRKMLAALQASLPPSLPPSLPLPLTHSLGGCSRPCRRTRSSARLSASRASASRRRRAASRCCRPRAEPRGCEAPWRPSLARERPFRRPPPSRNSSPPPARPSRAGAKQLSELIPLSGSTDRVTIHGFVSRPRAGHGRRASDRQYTFVNSRPVDFPRLARVVNDAFRASTAKSECFPFLLLNLEAVARRRIGRATSHFSLMSPLVSRRRRTRTTST